MKAAIPSRKKLTGTFNHDELEGLNDKTLYAVLATSSQDKPYTSLIAYAYDSREKTRNIGNGYNHS